MRRTLFLILMLILAISAFAQAAPVCSPVEFRALNTAGFVSLNDFSKVDIKSDGSVITPAGERITTRPGGGYIITDSDGNSREVEILTSDERAESGFTITEIKKDGTTITRQYESDVFVGSTQTKTSSVRSTVVLRDSQNNIIYEASNLRTEFYKESQVSQNGRTISNFDPGEKSITLSPTDHQLMIGGQIYSESETLPLGRIFRAQDGSRISIDDTGRLVFAYGLQETQATALRAEFARQLLKGSIESGIEQEAITVARNRGTARVTVDDLKEAQRRAQQEILTLAKTPKGSRSEFLRKKAELAGLYIVDSSGQLANDQYPLKITASGDILTTKGVVVGSCSGEDGSVDVCTSDCNEFPCELDLQPGAEVCKPTSSGKESCARMVSCGEDAPPGCVRSSAGPRNAPWSPQNIVDFVRGGPATQGIRSLGNLIGFRRDLEDAAKKYPKLFGVLKGVDIASFAAERICGGEIDPGEGISAVALSSQGGYIVPSMTKQRQSLTIGSNETCTQNCTYRYAAIVKLSAPEFEFNYQIILKEYDASKGVALFKKPQHLNKSTPANIVVPFTSDKDYQKICVQVLPPHDELLQFYYHIEDDRFPKNGEFCAQVFEGDRNDKTLQELENLAGGIPDVAQQTATSQSQGTTTTPRSPANLEQCAYQAEDIRGCLNNDI